VDGFTVDCGLANAETALGATSVVCSFQGVCATPNPNRLRYTDQGWMTWVPSVLWTSSATVNGQTLTIIHESVGFWKQYTGILPDFQAQNDFSWWGAFFSDLFSRDSFALGQLNARDVLGDIRDSGLS
jgi:hypothetical protein